MKRLRLRQLRPVHRVKRACSSASGILESRNRNRSKEDLNLLGLLIPQEPSVLRPFMTVEFLLTLL